MGVNQKLSEVAVNRFSLQNNTTETTRSRRRKYNNPDKPRNSISLSSATTLHQNMASATLNNDSSGNIAILGDKTQNLNPLSRMILRNRKQSFPEPETHNFEENDFFESPDDCPIMDDELPGNNSPRANDALNASRTTSTFKVLNTFETSHPSLRKMESPRANSPNKTSRTSGNVNLDKSGNSGDLTASFLEIEEDSDFFILSDNFKMSKRNHHHGRRMISQSVDHTRTTRGLSSPLRMLPPVALSRKGSYPIEIIQSHHENLYGTMTSTTITTTTATSVDDICPSANAPLQHNESFHLTFKTSDGDVIQVTGRQGRVTGPRMFSKRIRCMSVEDHLSLHDANALRIIGHTTNGIIRGGDRISLARMDGQVLRIQKMSRKLCFSTKIDAKAKFIILGVPQGTMVTDTTKFYLQSVYDRSKTIGFLKSFRPDTIGCLVMYAYRNKDDKSEPVQFFKRVQEQDHVKDE
jgi:hypothetical protein